MSKLSSKMSLLSLVLVSSAFVTSVRNLTSIAETGLHMIFFALVAVLFYFIPVALVSAELASGWPKNGGVYAWAKQAFGERWGFFTVWLQWSYTLFAVVSTLYFASSTFAFIFFPSLATNKIFVVLISLIIVWLFTAMSLRGQKTSSLISSVGFLAGVLLPAALIIILGIAYIMSGHTINLHFNVGVHGFFPDFHKISTLVLLVAFIRAFGGIEASSSHAGEVNNPSRNYPIAILIVVIVGLLINLLASMSIAVVIPQSHISLASGLISAFSDFLHFFHLGFLTKILAALITIGAIGGFSTWLMGPVKGLLATAENGDLPPVLQKVNKAGSPTTLLLVQGGIISAIVVLLQLLPNFNLAFWLSVALAMIAYSVMYIMLLLSGLRLRYTEPDTPRSYRIPCRNVGMWIVSCAGMLILLFAFTIDLFPPAQLSNNIHTLYISTLIIGAVIILSLPLLIFQCRKPSWKKEKV